MRREASRRHPDGGGAGRGASGADRPHRSDHPRLRDNHRRGRPRGRVPGRRGPGAGRGSRAAPRHSGGREGPDRHQGNGHGLRISRARRRGHRGRRGGWRALPRRRGDPGQARHLRIRPRRPVLRRAGASGRQPLERGARHRRVIVRIRRRRGGRPGARGARDRFGRVHPRPRVLLRHRRPQADLRPRLATRGVSALAEPRPCRSPRGQRDRGGSPARRGGRLRRARSRQRPTNRGKSREPARRGARAGARGPAHRLCAGVVRVGSGLDAGHPVRHRRCGVAAQPARRAHHGSTSARCRIDGGGRFGDPARRILRGAPGPVARPGRATTAAWPTSGSRRVWDSRLATGSDRCAPRDGFARRSTRRCSHITTPW